MQQCFHSLFPQRYLFLESPDLYLFDWYTFRHILQKPSIHHFPGRRNLVSLGGYSFCCKSGGFTYTTFNTGFRRIDVLLPPANFKRAQVVITV